MMDFYCPNCGYKFVMIAKTTLYSTEKGGKVSRYWFDMWKETLSGAGYSRMEIHFVACVKCKVLFAHYFHDGHHFDYLGDLTDETVSMIVAWTAKMGVEP